MSIKSPHERNKAAYKLIRTNIQDLPTEAVAHWVEYRRDKPRAWVRILASVGFLICSVAFFISLLPWRSVGRYNFDRGLQNSTMLILRKRQAKKNPMLKIESNVDIHGEKNTYQNIYACVYLYETTILMSLLLPCSESCWKRLITV